MYLSKIPLDPANRTTRELMTSPAKIHGAIEQSFQGDRKRNLWRIDRFSEGYHLYLLSEEPPLVQNISINFGVAAQEQILTRSYDPLLQKIQGGQIWQFRLIANPVKSVFDKNSERGKVVAHVTPQQQKKWLLDRSADYGFALDSDRFDVVKSDWKKFKKNGGKNVSLKIATFEGYLTVTNEAVFRNTLVTGIGRAKAYGCGMLTVMKPL